MQKPYNVLYDYSVKNGKKIFTKTELVELLGHHGFYQLKRWEDITLIKTENKEEYYKFGA